MNPHVISSGIVKGFVERFYTLEHKDECAILHLASSDGTNKLSQSFLRALLDAVERLRPGAERHEIKGLVITGNEQFFSAGADLNEIARLTGPQAFEFARLGQTLMKSVSQFPAPVVAAVKGYCMGGGMDLALACHLRIAAPNSVFGHRGAALGVMTGWGGTQRLPRLIGRIRALQMFLTAEMVSASTALAIGLVNLLADDPVARAAGLRWQSVSRPFSGE